VIDSSFSVAISAQTASHHSDWLMTLFLQCSWKEQRCQRFRAEKWDLDHLYSISVTQ